MTMHIEIYTLGGHRPGSGECPGSGERIRGVRKADIKRGWNWDRTTGVCRGMGMASLETGRKDD